VIGIFDFGSLDPGEATRSIRELGAQLVRAGGLT